MSNIRIAIVYYSKFGHTKLQAEAVRDGAASHPGAEVLLLDAAEATKRIDELDAYDAIVFGSATYMGSIAAGMKSFLEATVTKWGNGKWKDKIAGGFTNSSNFSGDKVVTMIGLLTTAMQLNMIWVGIGDTVGANEPGAESTINGPSPECINRNSASLGPMASSFGVKPPIAPPPGDVLTAKNYGLRIAQIAARFKK
ncbi:Flavodoxin FldP [bioreactor metagenome]|uniref:Flavodoxin FldP n=1 Tax=bioreactor metagenome TaxID=1076179 RepID=A0A645BG20_9ZZZZ